jgi:hypothetical protein
MQVPTAGKPGSGDRLAEKWQYRQFMPNCCTCLGCGKSTGCTGANPCDDDAPLYAERPNAATAMAKNPDASAHDRLRLIK